MKSRNQALLIVSELMLITAAVVACVLLRKYDAGAFNILAVLTVISSIALAVQLILRQRNIHSYIAKIDTDLATTQRDAIWLFPYSTCVLNQAGTILWYNRQFYDVFFEGKKEPFGQSAAKHFGIDVKKLDPCGKNFVIVGSKSYLLLCTLKNFGDVVLYLLTLEDITDHVRLQDEYKRTRQSVVLISIDNYEDLLQSAKESEKAGVYVETERLLEDFMHGTNGLLRKLSSERFVAVIEDQHLERLIAGRFGILDEARKVTVGEKLPLTLSIGVGRGFANLEQSEQAAKQALDMSMGRGGDQAAVKTEAGFEFFGGVSKGIEKSSKIKAKRVATALAELVRPADHVFVMGHRYGDLDAVGGATGLAGAIRKLGRLAYVVVDPTNNLAQTLIEKIKAVEGPHFYMTPQEALSIITDNSVLIIVDTHNKDFVESVELYQKAKHIAVIDHHRKHISYIDNAVLFYHEPFASSASEMITEIIQYLPEIDKLPYHFAEALLAGIVLDSKGFVMKAGVRTFEAAAYLKKSGADTIEVDSFFASSIDAYQKKTKLVSAAEFYKRCAIIVSPENSVDIRVVAPQAADELLRISNIDASFVIYDIDGVINISARSLGAVNVQLIMERLGGGGHQTMAATQLKGVSPLEAKEKLLFVIDDQLSQNHPTMDRI